MDAQKPAGRGKSPNPSMTLEPGAPMTLAVMREGWEHPGGSRIYPHSTGCRGAGAGGQGKGCGFQPRQGAEPQPGEITHITFKSSHIASPKDREMKSRGPAQQQGPGQGKGTGAGSCATLVAIPTVAEGGFGSPRALCHRLGCVSGCWEHSPGLFSAQMLG